jgi:hypothetical protein
VRFFGPGLAEVAVLSPLAEKLQNYPRIGGGKLRAKSARVSRFNELAGRIEGCFIAAG